MNNQGVEKGQCVACYRVLTRDVEAAISSTDSASASTNKKRLLTIF